MIDSSEASLALVDIDDIARRVRQSRFYQHASAMLMLWGVLTFAGYMISFVLPSQAANAWIAVFVTGVGGSIVIGYLSRRRAGVNTFDARATIAIVSFIAFGAFWSSGIGQFTPRQLGAFWSTYFMLPYILVGLWMGRAFVAIGVAVIAFTLIGYLWAGSWFGPWMALVNGGGLLLGGLWMRRS